MKKQPDVPKMKESKPSTKNAGFKTGVKGKVWGKEYNDWIPSLMLNPVR